MAGCERPNDGYRVVELRRTDLGQAWARVHLRPATNAPRIAGIER